jgi:transposase
MASMTQAEWEEIEPYIADWRRSNQRRAPVIPDRDVVEALLWLRKNDGGWRALPQRYPKWQTVRRRAVEWRSAGILDVIRMCLPDEPGDLWPPSRSGTGRPSP